MFPFHFGDRYCKHTDRDFSFRHCLFLRMNAFSKINSALGIFITFLSYTKKQTQVCIWQRTEAVFALDNAFLNVLYFQGHMYSSWCLIISTVENMLTHFYFLKISSSMFWDCNQITLLPLPHIPPCSLSNLQPIFLNRTLSLNYRIITWISCHNNFLSLKFIILDWLHEQILALLLGNILSLQGTIGSFQLSCLYTNSAQIKFGIYNVK